MLEILGINLGAVGKPSPGCLHNHQDYFAQCFEHNAGAFKCTKFFGIHS